MSKNTSEEIYTTLVAMIIIWLFEVIVGMRLWNYFMAGIFGLPVFSFWKFAGLKILINCLFPVRIRSNNNEID